MCDASIIIVTRNRKETAKRAIESALLQTGNNEIIVFDDASSDGTYSYLKGLFPAIKIERGSDQVGLIVLRNRASGVSNGRVLVHLDDDAVFVDPDVVSSTLQLFDDHRIGAVTIPHLNCYCDGRELLFLFVAPDDAKVYLLNTFSGGSCAIRRDVFDQVGGLQGYLFHWGEETDFCQRLYGLGYWVRCGTRIGVRHYPESKGKYQRKNTRYIHRNRILTVWFNAPRLYLIPLALAQIAICVRSLNSWQSFLAFLEGIFMAFTGIVRRPDLRRPIAVRSYRTWLYLRRHPLSPADSIYPEPIGVEKSLLNEQAEAGQRKER